MLCYVMLSCPILSSNPSCNLTYVCIFTHGSHANSWRRTSTLNAALIADCLLIVREQCGGNARWVCCSVRASYLVALCREPWSEASYLVMCFTNSHFQPHERENYQSINPKVKQEEAYERCWNFAVSGFEEWVRGVLVVVIVLEVRNKAGQVEMMIVWFVVLDEIKRV